MRLVQKMIEKGGRSVSLLLIAFSFFSVLATSKVSPEAIQQLLFPPSLNEAIITETAHTIQPLGLTEATLNSLQGFSQLFKHTVVKEEQAFVIFAVFQKVYSDPVDFFSYGFLRLNILSAKHHPPTL